MEMKVQAPDLQLALSRIHGIPVTWPADKLPPAGAVAFGSVHIDASLAHGRATLTAFDGTMGVVCEMPASVKKAGRATIRYDVGTTGKFLNSLRGDVGLARGARSVNVTSGKLDARLDERCPPDDFPRIPDSIASVPTAPIHGENFLAMLRRVYHATSKDGSRGPLCGNYLHALGEGRYRLVAVDGVRLAMLDRELGDVPLHEQGALLPIGALVKLKQLLENHPLEGWQAGGSRDFFVLAREGVRFFSKLRDDRFPDYQRLLPKESSGNTVVAPRERTLETLRRVALVCPGKEGCVQLNVEAGVLHMAARTMAKGEASDALPLAKARAAASVSYYNPTHLAELLIAAEREEVRFIVGAKLLGAHEGDEKSVAALVRTTNEDGFTGLIMPMTGESFQRTAPAPDGA